MKRKPHPLSLAQAQVVAAHYNAIAGNAMARRIDRDIGHATRMDANETVMLALQLEDMRTRVFETRYPELKARLYFPVASDVSTGAESYSYKETDEVGEAKVISNYGDDLPTVEVKGTKVTNSIVAVAIAYFYSLQDIRRAAFAGEPLDSRKASAARRLFERKVDEIAAVGSPDDGIATGLVNNASVSITALSAAGTWATKFGTLANRQQILDDLNALVRSMFVDSKEIYSGDTVLLPTAQYMLIKHGKLSADSDMTILEAFQRANPGIRVDSWNKLDGAGAASADRALCFAADPEVVEIINPQEFEVLPPQPKNLAFQVPCHGRTAGASVQRPLGMKYMDGI